jgi:peptidoglycan/xylan/chitin deacetylase (PgdA/CDA1 family)
MHKQKARSPLPIEPPTRETSPSASNAAADARRWLRKLLATSLFYSGGLRAVQFAGRYMALENHDGRLSKLCRATHPRFVVLCYHRVGVGGVPLFSELPSWVFEAQMRYIRRHYRVLSLDELCEEMQRPSETKDAVVVTFDDGYRDLYTDALPTLKKYQIPATIFLPIRCIETGEVPWYDRIFLALKVFPKDRLQITLEVPRTFCLDSYQARIDAAAEIIRHFRKIPDQRRKAEAAALEDQVTLPADALSDRMLTWEQVRTMCRDGVSFGSHTMTHPAVSQLSASQLESELAESKRILRERTGQEAPHFAYPFGQPTDCGTTAEPYLERYGYRSAVTTVEGINQPGGALFSLRRSQICNERSISMFALRLNQLFLTSPAKISRLPHPGGIASEAARAPEKPLSTVNSA